VGATCQARMIARTKMSSVRETGTDLHLEQARSQPDLEAVYRLRHQAYSAVGALPDTGNRGQRFSDCYDGNPNVQSYGIFRGPQRELLGSIRANLWKPELGTPPICAFERYLDEITVELGPNASFVESNRLVTNQSVREDTPGLQLALFRAIAINAFAHGVDYIIIAVRQRHAKVYQRLLRFEPISRPKPYPGLNVDMVLLAMAFPLLYPWLLQERPAFAVEPEEAARLALRLPGQTVPNDTDVVELAS